MLKKIFLGLGVFAVFIVLLLWWIRTDEDLSLEAEELLGDERQLIVDVEHHPYYQFLGLDAVDNVESEQLGYIRYRYEWFKYQGQKFSEDKAENLKKLKRDSLSSNENEVMKNLRESFQKNPESFKLFIQQNKNVLKDIIIKEAIPLSRLDKLLRLEKFNALILAPDATEPTEFFYNLGILEIAKIELSQKEKIITYNEIFEKWYKFDQKQISLLQKMFASKIMESLVDLIRATQLEENKQKLIQLPVLTVDQLSLANAMKQEVGFSRLSLPFSSSKGDEKIRSKYAYFYLKNKTINQVVEDWYPYKALSEQSYQQIKKNIADVKVKTRYRFSIKNYVGNILAQQHVNSIEWEKYLLRNLILNSKILAFNAVNQNLDVDTLNQNQQGYEFYKTKTELCIKNPHPNARHLSQSYGTDSCVLL